MKDQNEVKLLTPKDLIDEALNDSNFLQGCLYLAPVLAFLISVIIFLELNKELWK